MGPDDVNTFQQALSDIIRLIKAYAINPDGLVHYANLIIAKKKEEDLKREEPPEKGG